MSIRNKPIFTIMPDFGGAYGWVRDDIDQPSVGSCHADDSGWYAEPRVSDSLHKQFAEWQSEFEDFGRLSREEAKYFDWVDYHRRGIALAHRLKAELGDKAIVIYEKAFEDPCHHDAERREILLNSHVRKLPAKKQR